MKELLSEYLNQNLIIQIESSNISSLGRHTTNDKSHIFYAILRYIIKESSNGGSIDFLYLFHQYEKLLNHSRGNDENICSYLLSNIQKAHQKFNYENNLIKNGLDSLYNPSIAFYYYNTKKDFSLAEKHILESLANIDFLINAGFKDGIFMKIEQYLNMFRVYYNAKNYTRAKEYAIEVLSYILGENNTTFQYKFEDVRQSYEQLFEIYELFFNGIIFKSVNELDVLSNSFLEYLFSNLQKRNYNRDQEMDSVINIMYLILSKKDGKIINEMILDSNLFTETIPSSCRFLILEYILNQLQDNMAEDTINKVINYQTTKLNLRQELIFKAPIITD